jgi:hypothetical protein
MGENELPSNVARFEQLMYLSLGVAFIGWALSWNRLVAIARPVGGAYFVLFTLLFSVAFMMFLIWLVARRRKNWARWLLLIIGVLGLPSYISRLPQLLHAQPLAGGLSAAQLPIQAIALLLVFTGNAREWFKRTPTPVQA